MAISVHYQNVRFQIKDSTGVKNWLNNVIVQEGRSMGYIEFFFINDKSQRQINSEFLEHDYNTDVITFDYSSEDVISGDIYIGIETVKRNSQQFKATFRKEYLRVMLHGVLHLLAYNDKSEEELVVMRQKEEFYLNNF